MATNFIVAGMLGFLGLMSATAAQSVALNWNPSTGPNVAGYRIYYGPASQTYTKAITVGKVNNALISGLVGGATYYFGAKSFNAAGVESAFSNEASYTVPVVVATTRTTLNPAVNVRSSQNAAATPGNLPRLASSAANPATAYVRPKSAGTRTITPAANKIGTAVAASVPVTANAKAAVPLPAATLQKVTRAGSGNFSFQVAGVPGCQYVIQASADLVNWSAVQTNTAPFTFNDTNTATLPRCFYRTFCLPP